MSLIPPEALEAIHDRRVEDALRLLVRSGLDVDIELTMRTDGLPGWIKFIDNTVEAIDADDQEPQTASE